MKIGKKSARTAKKWTCVQLKRSKAKIKCYNGKINTNFHNNKILKIPKEASQFICLSVTLIDSVFRTAKNYHPQVFVEECKYVVEEN